MSRLVRLGAPLRVFLSTGALTSPSSCVSAMTSRSYTSTASSSMAHHQPQRRWASTCSTSSTPSKQDIGDMDDVSDDAAGKEGVGGDTAAGTSSSTEDQEDESLSTFATKSTAAVDAEVVAFSKRIFSLTAKGARSLDLHETVNADKRIEKRDVRSVGADEGMALEMQKLKANFEQRGAFGGYQKKDVMVSEVDSRKRRVTNTVPHIDPLPKVANETSFRRLPKNFRLPKEHELRSLYPQTTGLVLSMGEAHCADANAVNIDEEPLPVKYVKLLPKNYDKNRCYPHMVVLADGRGMPVDFEDVCANFFERPMVAQGLADGEWVVFCPSINVKVSWHTPQEAVVAKFCDWVVANHNVEHGRVHLFGKGYGAYCALRTCLEHPKTALSVVAVYGRGGTPYRAQDNVRNKVKHLDGVHILSYTPGLLWKQDWIYKFKFMMDDSNNRPAMRNIHYEGVFDHQIYYAINPHEFWNYLNYFRKYNCTMLTDGTYQHMDEALHQKTMDERKKAKEARGETTSTEDDWSFYSPPAFTQSEIRSAEVKEVSDEDWETKFGADEDSKIEFQGATGGSSGETSDDASGGDSTSGRSRRAGSQHENAATSL